MAPSLVEPALVYITVGEVLRALPVRQVVVPAALVGRAILLGHFAFTMALALVELAFVDVAACQLVDSVAMGFLVLHFALISVAVGHLHDRLLNHCL